MERQCRIVRRTQFGIGISATASASVRSAGRRSPHKLVRLAVGREQRRRRRRRQHTRAHARSHALGRNLCLLKSGRRTCAAYGRASARLNHQIQLQRTTLLCSWRPSLGRRCARRFCRVITRIAEGTTDGRIAYGATDGEGGGGHTDDDGVDCDLGACTVSAGASRESDNDYNLRTHTRACATA